MTIHLKAFWERWSDYTSAYVPYQDTDIGLTFDDYARTAVDLDMSASEQLRLDVENADAREPA